MSWDDYKLAIASPVQSEKVRSTSAQPLDKHTQAKGQGEHRTDFLERYTSLKQVDVHGERARKNSFMLILLIFILSQEQRTN